MSKIILENIIANLVDLENVTVDLIKITEAKNEISYITRRINFKHNDTLKDYLKELNNLYMNGANAKLNFYEKVCKYDSAFVNTIIYKLNINDSLINENYEKLINSINNVDNEIDPLELKHNGYVIKGKIKIGIDLEDIYIFVMNNPIKFLRNTYFYDTSLFKEYNKICLQLRKSIDVIIFKNEVYFFNSKGENLFKLEKFYKKTCDIKLKELKEKEEIFSNYEKLKETSEKGYNPRKFINYKNENLNYLCNGDNIKNIKEISLKDGKICTDNEEDCKLIINFLCGNVLMDYVSKEAKQVPTSFKVNNE